MDALPVTQPTTSVHVSDVLLSNLSLYKNCLVVLKTNIPDFRKSEMEVYRRFSDFLGLHEKLVEKHLRHGCIIPPPPEKSVIGMLTTLFASV